MVAPEAFVPALGYVGSVVRLVRHQVDQPDCDVQVSASDCPGAWRGKAVQSMLQAKAELLKNESDDGEG